MRKCAKCQTECSDEFKFCVNCGEPLPPLEQIVPAEQSKVTTKLDESEAAGFLTKASPFSSGLASTSSSNGGGNSDNYSPNIADWSDGDQPKWSSNNDSGVQAQIIKPTDSQNLENLIKDREKLNNAAPAPFTQAPQPVQSEPSPSQSEEDEKNKKMRNIIGIACCSCFTLAMMVLFIIFALAIFMDD